MNENITKDMLGRANLTSVKRAQDIFLQHLHVNNRCESLPLAEALGRVVATTILSPEDLPATPRSCMDGYAIIASDSYGASETMPAYLEISGEVSMGNIPEGLMSRGHCHKIPTGGSLPKGSDSVIMLEHTVPVGDELIEVTKSVGEGAHVSQIGDDIARGDIAITAGTKLRPQELGLLAGLGISTVEVYARPRIGILSTGDELLAHHMPIKAGKIRDINSVTLAAQAREQGAEVKSYGIVADNFDTFLTAMKRACSENDIVLFSGGSSVGMRDLGEQIITALGSPGVIVHGVALKPGKPVILGSNGECALVGLPGHPVSAMTCFTLFIEPAIAQLSGKRLQQYPKARIIAKLNRSCNSAPGRLDIVRVSLSDENSELLASPVLGKSGSISVLAKADGYFVIPEEVQGYDAGKELEVFLYGENA